MYAVTETNPIVVGNADIIILSFRPIMSLSSMAPSPPAAAPRA